MTGCDVLRNIKNTSSVTISLTDKDNAFMLYRMLRFKFSIPKMSTVDQEQTQIYAYVRDKERGVGVY